MEWRCTGCGTPHVRNNPPCRECGGMDFERAVVRLEWECDECGEPVERATEPCPNCGGTDFSRLHDPASEPAPLDDEVRVSTASESQQSTDKSNPQQYADNVVWECPNCGMRHTRNSPPCSRCGNARLETVDFDDVAVESASGGRLASLVNSSVLSTAGLALAAAGGLVVLYGGFVGSRTLYFEAEGKLPPGAWEIVVVGLTVGIVGAALVLFSTRQRDIEL